MLVDLFEMLFYFFDQFIFTKNNLLLNCNYILSARAYCYQKWFKKDT